MPSNLDLSALDRVLPPTQATNLEGLDLSILDKAIPKPVQQLDLSALDRVIPPKPTMQGLDLSALDNLPKASEQKYDVDKLESFTRGAAQSVTFGFIDEASAGVESVFTDKPYEQSIKETRDLYHRAEMANPKIYLTGEVMGGIASAVIPGYGWANAGVKGAAAAGAIYGAGTAESMSDVPEAMLKHALVAGATAGAFKLLGKGISSMRKAQVGTTVAEGARMGKPLEPEMVNQLADITEEFGEGIHKRAIAEFDQLKSLVPDEADLPGDFLRLYLNKAPGEKLSKSDSTAFFEVWKTADSAKQQARWDQFTFGKALKKATADFNKEYAEKIVKVGDPLESEWLGYFKDPMFRFREYDNVIGTNIEPMIAQFSDAQNHINAVSGPFVRRVGQLQKAGAKLFGGDQAKIARALEGEGLDALTAEQAKHVADWRSWFDSVKAHISSQGYTPATIENYFTQQKVTTDVAYRRVVSMWNKIKDAWNPESSVPEHEMFTDALEALSGTRPSTGLEVRRAIKGILLPDTQKVQHGFEASALFKREGTIPELLRETDVDKAAMRYLNSNLKSVYLEDSFKNLNIQREVLRGLGFDKGAAVLDHFADRMSGIPSGYTASVQNATVKWKAHFGSILDDPNYTVSKTVAKVFLSAPDLISWSTSQVYSNLLGWNLAAPIRNLTQPLFLTAPEIGGLYGRQVLGRGVSRAAKALAGGEKPGLFLESVGLSGGSFHGEGVRQAMEDGIHAIPSLGKAIKGIEGLGTLVMHIYSSSDTINRWFTWHMAQELMDDVAKKSPKAMKFMGRLSKGMKDEYQGLVARGQDQQARDLIAKWLVRKTQFNYGKAGLSQFGQEYGRLVSMFTKWPMMVAGDLTEMAKYRKGVDKVSAPMLKYIAPMAILGLMDMGLEDAKWRKSPLAKLTLANNLTKFSPFSSVLDVGISPMITMPIESLHALSQAKDGEIDKAKRTLRKATAPLTPGAGQAEKIYQQWKKFKGED